MVFLCLVIAALSWIEFSIGDSAKYCSLKVTTTRLFPSPENDVAKLIVKSPVSGQAISLIHASFKSNGVMTQQSPGKHGVFIDSPKALPHTKGFCWSGDQFLESADVNGDDRDDLICHDKVSGSINVMMRNNNGYEAAKSFARNFDCRNGAIVVGDFDGNNADDLLCIQAIKAPGNCSTYTIYFNQGCKTRHTESSHLHHRHHRNKVNYQPIFYNEYIIGPLLPDQYHGCNPNLPQVRKQRNIPQCLTNGFDIYANDINGDGKDDLVFRLHVSPWTVSYHLSDPASLSSVFSKKQSTPMTCEMKRFLFVNDVNGDGSADLICVGGARDKVNNMPQVSFYSGNGFNLVKNFADDCGRPFCKGTSVIPLASVFVGDFNNDGRADILCRFGGFNGEPITNEILFAEPL